MITLEEYLEIYNRSPAYSQYTGFEQDLEKLIEYNKALIYDYPFLMPEQNRLNEYDYTFTLLDDMPQGWRIAFGQQFLDELKSALVDARSLDAYKVLQIKEKFGRLCWYDTGGMITRSVVTKYENLSYQYCLNCGQSSTYKTKNWITFICKNCADKIFEEEVEYSKSYNLRIPKFDDLFYEKIEE